MRVHEELLCQIKIQLACDHSSLNTICHQQCPLPPSGTSSPSKTVILISPPDTQQLVGWAWPSEKDSPPRKWVALKVDTNPVNDPGCSSENKKSYLMVEIIVIMIMI